jgi:hypothetical protein
MHSSERASVVQPAAALAVSAGLASLPTLFRPTPAAAKCTLEFFTAQIRNPNTRKAYARWVSEFAAWCEAHGLHDLAGIEPVHVAAYIKQIQQVSPRLRTSDKIKSRSMKSSGS